MKIPCRGAPDCAEYPAYSRQTHPQGSSGMLCSSSFGNLHPSQVPENIWKRCLSLVHFTSRRDKYKQRVEQHLTPHLPSQVIPSMTQECTHVSHVSINIGGSVVISCLSDTLHGSLFHSYLLRKKLQLFSKIMKHNKVRYSFIRLESYIMDGFRIKTSIKYNLNKWILSIR